MKKGVDYIGVTCVFYCHDGKGNLLLHKRSQKCRDEKGRWDCGGGAMKFGESFEQTMKREVKEEYCCNIEKLVPVGFNNVIRNEGKVKTHWIAILYAAKVDSRKVKIGNTSKLEKIGWFKPNKLPVPLHSMYLIHLESVKKAVVL